jgi:hypothetical protein
VENNPVLTHVLCFETEALEEELDKTRTEEKVSEESEEEDQKSDPEDKKVPAKTIPAQAPPKIRMAPTKKPTPVNYNCIHWVLIHLCNKYPEKGHTIATSI